MWAYSLPCSLIQFPQDTIKTKNCKKVEHGFTVEEVVCLLLPKCLAGALGADQQLPTPSLRGIREIRETNSERSLIKLGSKQNQCPGIQGGGAKIINNPHQLQKHNTIKRLVQDVMFSHLLLYPPLPFLSFWTWKGQKHTDVYKHNIRRTRVSTDSEKWRIMIRSFLCQGH